MLAGGLAGQLTTLILGNRLTESETTIVGSAPKGSNPFQSYLRSFPARPRVITSVGQERYENSLKEFTFCIQLATPRKKLKDAMEKVFQHARDKKQGAVENHDEWVESLRRDADILRNELAKMLHSSTERRRLIDRPS